MTPQQVEALKQHADAIAEILYADTDPETLKTLEGIEQTVRDKLLEHVSPQIGIFLSATRQEPSLGESEP